MELQRHVKYGYFGLCDKCCADIEMESDLRPVVYYSREVAPFSYQYYCEPCGEDLLSRPIKRGGTDKTD